MGQTDPFTGMFPPRHLTEGENIQALRSGIAAETDALNLYEAHLATTDDPIVRGVLTRVRDDEREHLAWLTAALERLDPAQSALMDSRFTPPSPVAQAPAPPSLPVPPVVAEIDRAVEDLDAAVAGFGMPLLANPQVAVTEPAASRPTSRDLSRFPEPTGSDAVNDLLGHEAWMILQIATGILDKARIGRYRLTRPAPSLDELFDRQGDLWAILTKRAEAMIRGEEPFIAEAEADRIRAELARHLSWLIQQVEAPEREYPVRDEVIERVAPCQTEEYAVGMAGQDRLQAAAEQATLTMAPQEA